MLNNLFLSPSGLNCNMESLISDLRQQYSAAAAAAASTAVSRAMLIQAMSNQHSRQALTIATPPPQSQIVNSQEQHSTSRVNNRVRAQTEHVHQPVPATSQAHSQVAIKTALGQCAPLDLSVNTRQPNNQTTRSSRGANHVNHRRQPALPLDLARNKAQVINTQQKLDNQNATDLNNNNNRQQPQSRLISSSTSPSETDESTIGTSASLTRISSSSPASCNELNDVKLLNQVEGTTQGQTVAATDVISSTNGRRSRRQTNKKQKDPKSHFCNHCGRSFSRSDMLTRHSRLHSGLKPYQCGKCFQVFSRSDHLSTHERTHTGEKPYQCGICAYSACRRDMITRHMRTHLGQRIKPRVRTRKTSHSRTNTTSSTTNDRRRHLSDDRERQLSQEHSISTYCDDRHDRDERDSDFT